VIHACRIFFDFLHLELHDNPDFIPTSSWLSKLGTAKSLSPEAPYVKESDRPRKKRKLAVSPDEPEIQTPLFDKRYTKIIGT
jgi:hypothetical protein